MRRKERGRERETSSEKESNRRRRRTNRELHSGPIHRRIIQSDMTIRLCDPSIHIGLRQPVTDASFTPTQRHTNILPLGLAYTATRHLYRYGESF